MTPERKVVVITEASRGIGLLHRRALSGRGATFSGAFAAGGDCHAVPYNGGLCPEAGSVESACPRADQPRPATQRTIDEFRIQRVASVAAAFLLAALAPALVMAALWHAAMIVSAVFAFTFAIALYHAFFFGLPLFLVFRSKGWINVMSCVVSGFAVGALPAGVLTWPMQHPIVNGVVTAAGWVNYVKPLIYFGSFGALGGFVFWVALISGRHRLKSCRGA
jgi:NAD(P)-dependent dehydrogenase (short-subunit alcohol dehydrogenase family)